MSNEIILRLGIMLDDDLVRESDYYIVSYEMHQRMLNDFQNQLDSITAITESEAYIRQYVGSILKRGGKFFRAITSNTVLPVVSGTAYISVFDPEREYNDEDLCYLGGSIFIRRSPGKGNFNRRDWVLMREVYKLTDVTYYPDNNPTGEETSLANAVVLRLGFKTTNDTKRPKDTDPDVEAELEDDDGLGELFDTLEIHDSLEVFE